ncbi:MAG: DNA primase [Lentimicrobiaceae bacterium]|nr:DNA primase [Lentimicrobiaceae bacterium]
MIPQHVIASILDASRIEEVVGEFVSLKKRGANLIGVCPFHQEKTPSFIVSPSKGIFKCFGCGKAGDSVRFIMEHEHYSYPEALRFLAKKYAIEIEEREQTPEELVLQNEREQMFNVNLFAQHYFSETLFHTDEGHSVGLSYFKERDFREAIIKKFQLGFNLNQRDAFSTNALAKGYSKNLLLKVGLSTGTEERLFDRFQGRVIFPIHNLTGKVIGFGGRILTSDKTKAKYLNSPESEIYNKSASLYGIYFAKNAISKFDQCLLVEGYTDVLSMHQAGIENVVASSGTSLTTDQIRLIKRYTKNITMLYDGDNAGIKASLRGTDMILEEGMNVRIVVLPENEDPDSFVRKHTTNEVLDFIKANEKDFISFKTTLLLSETQNDPIKKAQLLKEIVASIALIPDALYRATYMKECSRLLDTQEQVLVNELNKQLRAKFKKTHGDEPISEEILASQTTIIAETPKIIADSCFYQERELIRLLLLYGNEEMLIDDVDENGNPTQFKDTVMQFLVSDLVADSIVFEHETHQKIFSIFQDLFNENVPANTQLFTAHNDDDVAQLAADLLATTYELHHWNNKNIHVKTEEMILYQLVFTSLYRYKEKLINIRLAKLENQLKETTDSDEQINLIIQIKQLKDVRRQINAILGVVITK